MEMNYSFLNKSLFILRHISKNKSVSFSTASCHLLHNSQKTSEFTKTGFSRTINESSSQFKNRPKKDEKQVGKITSHKGDSHLREFVSSNTADPDSFGTLSSDWKIQQKLKSMPHEKDDIVETNFLHNKEGKTRLSTNKYGKLIKSFMKQKKIGDAIDVLETRMLKDDRAKPESYIYNLLIGACGRVGYTKKAFQLYKLMRDRGLKVSGRTYTGLFNACANSPFPERSLEQAQHLRATLVEKAVLMNPIIYHAMIKAFGRRGDLETAFLLVDEMLEKRIKVSSETFNFLLQACITDKTAGFRHALLVWRKMMEKRVQPCLYSFNLLLRCSRDCGLGDEATTLQVIQILLQAGQRNTRTQVLSSSSENKTENQLTTTSTSDNLPNLICQQPNMGSVTIVKNITLPEHRLMLMGGSPGILEQMKLYKLTPDIKTYTQLLDQIPSTITAEKELLESIKRSQVSLDIDFCNMLIRKRCLRGDYEVAKHVLAIIQEENLRPDIMTFGVLAMSCHSVLSAHQLLQDIDNIGFRPNVEILGTLLKNACFIRNCEFVMEVMKILEKEDLKPNNIFLKHLDNFYRFASNTLSKESTDNTGMLKLDQFKEYCKYYQRWHRKMKPDEEPHPWDQFKEISSEPEDVELKNYGKVKYAK